MPSVRSLICRCGGENHEALKLQGACELSSNVHNIPMSEENGASGCVRPTHTHIHIHIHNNVRREGAGQIGNGIDEAIQRWCDSGLWWLPCVLGTDVERGSRGRTQESDKNGEKERTDVLKNTAEGQVGQLRFRQRTQWDKRNPSVCKYSNLSSLSIIPTHTHKQIHRQPDGAICRACPIKLHPLVKKMYGCNALPQTHKHTNTQIHTHSRRDACVHYKQVTKHNSLAHTHRSDFHHLIYFAPQQRQDAEESSSTTISVSPRTSLSFLSFHFSRPALSLHFPPVSLFIAGPTLLASLPLSSPPPLWGLTGAHMFLLKALSHWWLLLHLVSQQNYSKWGKDFGYSVTRLILSSNEDGLHQCLFTHLMQYYT